MNTAAVPQMKRAAILTQTHKKVNSRLRMCAKMTVYFVDTVYALCNVLQITSEEQAGWMSWPIIPLHHRYDWSRWPGMFRNGNSRSAPQNCIRDTGSLDVRSGWPSTSSSTQTTTHTYCNCKAAASSTKQLRRHFIFQTKQNNNRFFPSIDFFRAWW